MPRSIPLPTALTLQNIRAQAEARDLPEHIIEQMMCLAGARIVLRETAGRNTTVQMGTWNANAYILDNLQDSFILVCMERQRTGCAYEMLDGLAHCIRVAVADLTCGPNSEE